MTMVESHVELRGIPLAVVLLVTAAVYGRSALHQPNRYRPGKAWTYPPAWYRPHPEAISDVVGEHAAIEGSSDAVAVGGASGEW